MQTNKRTGTFLLAGSARREVMQGGLLECVVEQLGWIQGLGNSGFGRGETPAPRRILASGDQGSALWAGSHKCTGLKARTSWECQAFELFFFFLSSPAFINFLLLFRLVISLICSLPHRIKKSHGQIRAIGWKGARDNSGADLGQRWNPGPRFHTFDRASKCRTCCQDSSETC